MRYIIIIPLFLRITILFILAICVANLSNTMYVIIGSAIAQYGHKMAHRQPIALCDIIALFPACTKCLQKAGLMLGQCLVFAGVTSHCTFVLFVAHRSALAYKLEVPAQITSGTRGKFRPVSKGFGTLSAFSNWSVDRVPKPKGFFIEHGTVEIPRLWTDCNIVHVHICTSTMRRIRPYLELNPVYLSLRFKAQPNRGRKRWSYVKLSTLRGNNEFRTGCRMWFWSLS